MENFLRFILDYANILFYTLIVGFLFWFYNPSDTISIMWFMFLGLPAWIYVLLSFESLFKMKFQKNDLHLPKLKQVINEDLCILEPSELFSERIYVSVYHCDDYERLVAVGYVDTVMQTTKNLQIKIVEFKNNTDNKFIKKNKVNIILKPTIPYDA